MTNRIEIDWTDGIITITLDGRIVDERRKDDETDDRLSEPDRNWVGSTLAGIADTLG